jgi:hypothetical protein
MLGLRERTICHEEGNNGSPVPNHVRDFRHAQARRKNNPAAGIAPTYEVPQRQTTRYAYDPYLDPQLSFDGQNSMDRSCAMSWSTSSSGGWPLRP